MKNLDPYFKTNFCLLADIICEQPLILGAYYNGPCICVFSVWPLPEVQIDFESRFQMVMSIFLLYIFFQEFLPILKKKSKNEFPIVFQNCNFEMD